MLREKLTYFHWLSSYVNRTINWKIDSELHFTETVSRNQRWLSLWYVNIEMSDNVICFWNDEQLVVDACFREINIKRKMCIRDRTTRQLGVARDLYTRTPWIIIISVLYVLILFLPAAVFPMLFLPYNVSFHEFTTNLFFPTTWPVYRCCLLYTSRCV